MTAGPRIAGPICALAGVLLGLDAAQAGTLDPFRRSTDAPKAGATLDPFRPADGTFLAQSPAQSPASPPATASTPPPEGAPLACQRDEDCPRDNICQANVCQKIELATNIAYLYYREGSFLEVLGLYWSRKGSTGYRVVAPFYWHFWSPTSKSRVVAPFYWRFEDYAKDRTVTVVFPVSWTRQPDARSFAIWPLFYASTKHGWAVPLLGTFKVADPDAGKSFGAIALLYWWRRAPGRAFDLGIPLFVSKRSTEGAFTFALPLNVYWRNQDDANLLAIPLFYWNRHDKGSAFYTWLGYRRRSGAATSAAVAWLYWFGGNERTGSKYDVLFPLIWSFRTPASNTTVVGPFLHFRRETRTFDVGIPIWWSAGDEATGRSFKLLLPLFYWHRSDGGKSAQLVTLFGGYGRDDEAKTKAWFFWPILSLFHRDPESTLRVLTPLYVSHTSRPTHSTTRLISLLFYQRQDLEGSTATLFPLYWRFREADTGATANLLFPIFFRRTGPRDTTTAVGPFYWRSFKNGGWSAGVFPVAYFGNNHGRRHSIVFPLWWKFESASARTVVLLPFYYETRDRRGFHQGVPFLLSFEGDRDGRKYDVLFPVLWRFENTRDQTSTTVTPIGYVHRDPDGWSLGLGPLLPLLYARSGKNASHFALVPLVWHFRNRAEDRSTTVVGPYLHRRQGGETTDALFPLVYYRRGARPGGSDETSFTLLPLVHYRRDAFTRVLVTPVAVSARGPRRAAGFIGPYFWFENQQLSARFIPLLHADITRRDTGERARHFGPWFEIDAPGKKSRVLFPLFGRYVDDKESDTWVFPTYFRMRRTNGDRVDTFLPLFWRSSFGGRTTTVVGPYYDRSSPGVRNTGLVPLFFRAVSPERGLTVAPPLLYYHRWQTDGQREVRWAALYFDRKTPESRIQTLFPLYWSRDRGPRHQRLLFPIYWHASDDTAKTSWTLAGPFFSSDAGTWRTRGLLPLGWYTRDAKSGYAANAVLPLFYQSSGPDRVAFLTPVGGYSRTGASRYWYALAGLPLFARQTPDRAFNTFFPLWFSHTNKVTETTTRVIPPLLFVSRTNPEKGFTGFLGLFWRHYDVASSTTLGLPLFYDFNEYHLSRTTIFLPLFYRHATPTNITTIGFPLLWDFKRGDNRTTVVFPFYWRWRRPDHIGTLVFPFYFKHEGITPDGAPDGTYRRFVGFVLPVYDSGVKRPGDFMWQILGGLVGQERIGPNRYLRLFYLRFDTGPAPRSQTAWYSQPTRPPRRTAARGLNVVGF